MCLPRWGGGRGARGDGGWGAVLVLLKQVPACLRSAPTRGSHERKKRARKCIFYIWEVGITLKSNLGPLQENETSINT